MVQVGLSCYYFLVKDGAIRDWVEATAIQFKSGMRNAKAAGVGHEQFENVTVEHVGRILEGKIDTTLAAQNAVPTRSASDQSPFVSAGQEGPHNSTGQMIRRIDPRDKV